MTGPNNRTAACVSVSRDVVWLGGLPIDRIGREKLVDHIFAALADGTGGWLITVNLDLLRGAASDPSLRTLYAQADWIGADGVPILWASRLRGRALPDRIAGSDLVWLLAGRAAEGLIDGGVTLHVRLYTEASIGDVAQTLVDFGYEEPGFETAQTRFGRLDRLRLADEGVEVLLTRCPPNVVGRSGVDLFSGKPVSTASLAEVRGKMG